jgi:hypothetical protein
MSAQDDREHSALVSKFLEELPSIVESVDYDELYGHQLIAGDFYDKTIVENLLYKFLKANAWDYDKSKDQLVKTLKWRKQFNPLKAAFIDEHDSKFSGVVTITQYKDVISWNLYNTGDPKQLFVDLDAFLRFRIGVMERSLQLLDFGENDYMVQIHDYDGLSFLRFDPDIKKGSRATIKIFQDYYPELLKQKFFVNVPVLMTWVYEFVKRWINKETSKKFIMCSKSEDLVKYLGEEVPKKYGGKGNELKDQAVEITQTPYTGWLLQKQFTEEVD